MLRTALFFALAILLSVVVAAESPASAVEPGPDPREAAGYEALVGQLVAVRTSGGGSFRGTLFSASEDRIELASQEGAITAIAKSSILSLDAIDPKRDRAEYFQDSASNRLILMPTGFGMDPGEFHVAAQEIVAITASYGITQHLSAWGGVSIPGAVANLRWSTKLAERVALSVGALTGIVFGESAGLGLGYALASFGHENRNLTLGFGIPAAWDASTPIRPLGLVGTVAGKMIVSPTTSVVTENWIIAYSDGWAWSRTELDAFPAAVFRIAGDRFSWDIGAVVPLFIGRSYGSFIQGLMDGGTIIPIPILSVTYRVN